MSSDTRTVIDLECAVVRIEQIWDEFKKTGDLRTDLLDRLATCDVPRLRRIIEETKYVQEIHAREGD